MNVRGFFEPWQDADFNDALLLRVEVDFVAHTATFDFQIQKSNQLGWGDGPRDVRLSFKGVIAYVLPPPAPESEGLWVREGTVDELREAMGEEDFAMITESGGSVRCFYVIDWETVIYVIAEEEHFNWIDQ